jgi:hypothetical protein
MATTTTVYTHAHSITYVTDQILNSIKRIIVGLELNPSNFTNDIPVLERGIKKWLETGHLTDAVLEIKSSAGLVTRCDFTIDYGYSTSDGAMWVDMDAIRFSILKLGVKPNECTYNIKVQLKSGAQEISGWGACEFLSTAGFIKQNLGTTIGTNSIGSQAGYWRKA